MEKDIYLVNHYSLGKPLIAKLIDISKVKITLEFTDSIFGERIIEGHPVVITKEDTEVNVLESVAEQIDIKGKRITFRIDNVISHDNNRMFERFPVSIYSSFYVKDKKRTAVVKNLSILGMCVITKEDLPLNRNYKFSLFIDEREIPIKATTIWKKREFKNEYGLKLEHDDYTIKNSLRLYLNILKDEQANQMNQI